MLLWLAIACSGGHGRHDDSATTDDTSDTVTDTSDSTDTTDTTDTDDGCVPTDPQPTGTQVWVSRPDGTCAQSPSSGLSAAAFALRDWSPDSTRVRIDADSAVWHVDLDGSDATAAPDGVISPDWTLAALSSGSDTITLSIAPVAGGDPITVDVGSYDYSQGVSWSPDGEHVQINVENTSTAYGDGSKVYSKAGVPERNYVGQYYEGGWRWSPDSSLFVDIYGNTSDEFGIWIVPLDSGHAPWRPFTTQVGQARWMPSSHAIVTTTSIFTTGTPGAWLVDIDQSTATPLWTRSDRVDVLGVSPDGARAVVRHGAAFNDNALTVLDLDGADPVDVAIGGVTYWQEASFSPDSQWLEATGLETASGKIQVWVMHADGSAPLQLTHATDRSSAYALWSRDSTRIGWVGAPPTP